jgi:hypothetical protein
MANHVFISYVRENSVVVERLASDLRKREIEVWLDRDTNRIRPGERWQDVIRQAIRSGAIFLACFSSESAERDKSYMNAELTLAIEELQQRPANRAWFVPVLLAGGDVPDRSTGGGESLRHLQWVNLAENWEAGIESIAAAARRAVLAAGAVEPATHDAIEANVESTVLVVLTLGSGNITRNAAHLYGSASTAATRTWFDFAATPELNYSIHAVNGFGVADMLKPNTTYYFRFVGQDLHGRTVRGDVQTFMTFS